MDNNMVILVAKSHEIIYTSVVKSILLCQNRTINNYEINLLYKKEEL